MSDDATPSKGQQAAVESALEGGNYEVIRARLIEQAKALGAKTDALNAKRKETFGGTELTVTANERIRTENNCVPRDIVNVGGRLLFGYNVHLGLRSETTVGDVFSAHNFAAKEGEEAFDLSQVPTGDVPFLSDSGFVKEFNELYSYYKETKLLQLRVRENRLLAVFQVGTVIDDIKVFRWNIDVEGNATYVDNRGDRFHTFPPAHDFEWTETGRDDHVMGRHPHVNIEDKVFVETVGGDLTVKVEDNTDDGKGIYAEPVEDRHQSLDDAEVHYAKVGVLILIKILPYREETWRYLVFNTRSQHVARIDAIGQACVQLPENHGIIFPGGYYLQSGETKVFSEDTDDLEFMRAIRSPNGEDVLYVFHQRADGSTVLLPYNLIRKEVASPIHCHGYSIFDDGAMTVFKATSDEPTRVHPMQVWQTPFVSHDFAAQAPTDGSFLAKVGNAELVRGISDAYSVQRLIANTEPSRHTYEDLVKATTRTIDSYYWLDNSEVGDLASTLSEVQGTAELIIDEFEKVLALRATARAALQETEGAHDELLRGIHPDDWRAIGDHLRAMTDLRHHRGHIITLREIRYVDLERLDELEAETAEAFDTVSKAAVAFLLGEDALTPLTSEIDTLMEKAEAAERVMDVDPLNEELDKINEGLTVLSEVVGDLQVDDPSARTQIVESISEVFAQLNRVRATIGNRRKALLRTEGKADFGAQFKLFGQNVSSAIALADTPEKCDEQLSRVMVQLEELESRFSEFDEFIDELAAKREEVYDGFSAKKQTLLDERNRRVQNLTKAAERILTGVNRRAQSFKEEDELNAYFASDAMVMKLRQLSGQLTDLGDTVKADELASKLKSAKQDAMRGLRDRTELFEDGESVIKLGKHRFSVNTQPLELAIVPWDDGVAIHLTGTDFYEPIEDPRFTECKDLWSQTLASETDEVYRAEFLAASILFNAEARKDGLTVDGLLDAERSANGLIDVVRKVAADRYDEGYDRGIHDADAAKILEKMLALRTNAGLLRFAPKPRALASLFWAFAPNPVLHRRAGSLGRLRASFASSPAELDLAEDISEAISAFATSEGLVATDADLRVAGRYLLEELIAETPRFVISHDGTALAEALLAKLDTDSRRRDLDGDLQALEGRIADKVELVTAWLEAFVASSTDDAVAARKHSLAEAAVHLVAGTKLDREPSSALTSADVEGLLGSHSNVRDGKLHIQLDEFLGRLGDFIEVRVPRYREYRKLRHTLIEEERARLRIDEFMPRVLSSFVRNKLINDVYLPLMGDNLAKQIGALGEGKRTDLMGMLLLISPPGYGKTTLMEYMANSLGMVFMKVNGPSLGHAVTSIDPSEAPNATARQEVEKINLALEMGNNVMLYLDDIQHTHPELLQKFISLCDAQRRIEGVWNGKTKTYDLRGKKFAVVMAGNPYMETGEKFQIPDMLANRADTYNLGDILNGREEAFALSYIENSLTSNSVLAPLAIREQADVYKLIRMINGEPIPANDLSHAYSSAELTEIKAVLQRMTRCQDVLLKVNATYIESASQSDEYRTEPRFQLQGSYRNMNKLAEKVVSAMNEEELEALIDDHYAGEAQTLTTGAEHNLLKLGELRGTMTDEEQERWTQIKKDFGRIQLTGGNDDDPVNRVTGTLGGLGQQLDGIRESLASAVASSEAQSTAQTQALLPQLARLEAALAAMAKSQGKSLAVQVKNEPPPGLDELLSRQVSAIEQTLVPMAMSTAKSMEASRALGRPLAELIELLRLQLITGETKSAD